MAAPTDPEPERRLIFEDEFNTLDYDVWQHERTASGGGVSRNFFFLPNSSLKVWASVNIIFHFLLCLQNWEFQIYDNNRSNSYVRDGILYIKPVS